MAAPVVSTVAGDHLGERFVLDRASEIQCLEIMHGPIVLCKTGVPTGEFLAGVEGPALGLVVVELEYVVKHHGLGGADPAHPVNVDHTAAFEVGGAAEPFGMCQRAEPLLTIEKVLADAGGLFVMARAAEERPARVDQLDPFNGVQCVELVLKGASIATEPEFIGIRGEHPFEALTQPECLDRGPVMLALVMWLVEVDNLDLAVIDPFLKGLDGPVIAAVVDHENP